VRVTEPKESVKTMAEASPKSPPSTGGSLSEALQAFASEPPPSALDVALRDFAKAAEPKKPPPWAPVKPPPGPAAPPSTAGKPWAPVTPPAAEEPRKNAAPQPAPGLSPTAHLAAAMSYIGDVNKVLDGSYDAAKGYETLYTLTQAARHVADARQKDPDVVFHAKDVKGEPYDLKPDQIATRILYRECILAKSLADLTQRGREHVHEMLVRARTAIESALKYEPWNADFHFKHAELCKLLGDKDVGMAAVNKALEYDPHHVDAIKFLDSCGGEWRPFVTPPPPPKPEPLFKFGMPSSGKLLAIGVVLLFITLPIIGSGNGSGFVAIMGFGSLAIIVYAIWGLISHWKYKEGKEMEYMAYKSSAVRQELHKMEGDALKQRYDEEQRHGR
jgi:hypothetical protein